MSIGTGPIMAEVPRISVFTPTYNSAKYLHRVYESLQGQTVRSFEWIIVNDGSDDNTDEVVAGWIEENPSFPIHYHRFPENRGKIAASNEGVRRSSGELFLNVDADDRIKPEALERFLYHWDRLSPEEQSGLKGVTALCEDQYGELVGNRFPADPLVCDYYDFKFKYKIVGEKFDIVRTDLMREYPFHEEIDKHIVLSHVWFEMALKYKMYCINEVLRTYYRFQKGHTSLSDRSRKLKYLNGHRHYALLRINKFFPRIKSWKFKLQAYIVYIRYSIHLKISVVRFFSDIESISRRVTMTLLFPVGALLALADRLQGRV